jgi:hypothetical protein
MSNLLVQNIKHTNNTTAMVVDTTGRVTQPKKPAFQASINTAGWSAISDTSNGNNFDVGGDFNTSSYRFVAPVTGKYQFNVIIYSFNSDSVNAFNFYKNGSILQGSSNPYQIVGGQSGSVDETITGSMIADLSASDYMDIRAATASDYYANLSHFSGHLIG